MNIVKMQDTLKDLSDRQLLQTMQAGSTPQYLVLAEMQRRKKARDNYAQERKESGSDRSVAEDIISGIAAVPTGPMQMAEGGIVSFAKGGKTGRAKGEEEACWTDSRTGEKYCPPNTPQTEMPRKRFEEGGPVGIPPDEMAEMEVARRLQELQATNPNATRGEALRSLMREGSDIIPAMYPSNAQTSPTDPMPQPDAPFPAAPGQTESSAGSDRSERRRGTGADGGLSLSELIGGIADQNFFGNFEDDMTAFLRRIAPGTRGDESFEGTGELAPAAGGSPTAESAAGLPFLRFKGEQVIPPVESLEEDRARQQEEAQRDQVEREEEPAREQEPAPENVYAEREPQPQPQQTAEPEATEEDGLMQLMRELQTERQESREGARERALNEALIRGGLTMAASDDPNFLSTVAEGGIGGLAGYQDVMGRAAERQGEISSEMVDLAVAREANDLRRQAEAAQRAGTLSDLQFNRIDVLQGELENVNTQLLEGAVPEEQAKQLRQRQEQLREALKRQYRDAGIELPKTTGGGDLNYGPDALIETP